ncbi:MAG TPA: hypothetical protein VI818_04190, partial [Candidatus Thermoplasmatota archaeon]|nr:hypothetical protein [Candidatus Thermoplasmatota archaeon]
MQYGYALAIVAGLFAASVLVPMALDPPRAPAALSDDGLLAPRDPCQGPNAKGPVGPLDILSGKSQSEDVKIPSIDGHQVPATIHKPVEAGPDRRTPVLLHSHGWS